MNQEREALEALVRRHAAAVYRLAYARTGSRADAEDVMQEVFLRLVRFAPAFRDEEHARAWLLRVTVNRANSLYRAPWRQRELPLEDGLSAPAVPEEGGVLEAVLSLPPKYRIPVYLYYYEELDVSEIAQAMGRKEPTVRTWLFRGRGLLRELLGEEEAHEHV